MAAFLKPIYMTDRVHPLRGADERIRAIRRDRVASPWWTQARAVQAVAPGVVGSPPIGRCPDVIRYDYPATVVGRGACGRPWLSGWWSGQLRPVHPGQIDLVVECPAAADAHPQDDLPSQLARVGRRRGGADVHGVAVVPRRLHAAGQAPGRCRLRGDADQDTTASSRLIALLVLLVVRGRLGSTSGSRRRLLRVPLGQVAVTLLSVSSSAEAVPVTSVQPLASEGPVAPVRRRYAPLVAGRPAGTGRPGVRGGSRGCPGVRLGSGRARRSGDRRVSARGSAWHRRSRPGRSGDGRVGRLWRQSVLRHPSAPVGPGDRRVGTRGTGRAGGAISAGRTCRSGDDRVGTCRTVLGPAVSPGRARRSGDRRVGAGCAGCTGRTVSTRRPGRPGRTGDAPSRRSGPVAPLTPAAPVAPVAPVAPPPGPLRPSRPGARRSGSGPVMFQLLNASLDLPAALAGEALVLIRTALVDLSTQALTVLDGVAAQTPGSQADREDPGHRKDARHLQAAAAGCGITHSSPSGATRPGRTKTR